ncbi:MAG: hypothetical protein VXX02_04190 [Pseudomonadota bacterium]|nr:hypothetical protein [Pseudomonadota bacterium]MED6342637.1 hypothetical protein [Pseudomonadota bacterium]
MTSFKEEFMRSRELAELGIDAELYRNDDGMLLVRQVPPPPVTITPEGDIDMGTVGEALEELPEALAAGASGLMQGATAATVGLPGDLVAIGNAAVDYYNQGDVAQALTILSDMSEQYGSGRVKQFFDENLPEVFSDKAKVAADVSRTYGEFGGVGTAAVAGARQVPPALRAIDRAGQRAQARLDENVGATLMSGVDPTKAADELIAGAGKVARLMLPDVQKQMKMDKRMSMQPPAVLEALTDQDRELIKKLATEKRASQTVEPGLDDMSIIDADEFMRARAKQEPATPPAPQMVRKQDELGFYSRAQEFVDNLKQEKFTGPQLKGQMLNAGVKPDELKWTGLDEFLDKNPKLTKQEVMDFIEDNKVRLEEITYEGGTLSPETHQSFSEAKFIRDEEEIQYRREIIDDELEYHLEGVVTKLGVEQDDIPMHIDAYKDLVDAQRRIGAGASQEILRPLQAKYPEVDLENFGREVDAELDILAEEFYRENPYYQVDGEGALDGYRIYGNEDTGYYLTYKGKEFTHRGDPVYSLNEAQVQIQADAMDRGLLEEFMDQTQYSEYTQPGAENYREVLLTNPEYKGDPSFKLTEAQEARFQELGDKVNAEKESRPSQIAVNAFDALSEAEYDEFVQLNLQRKRSLAQDDGVRSPHWVEDDVVAHARLSDRVAPDSFTHSSGLRADGKVLYIEEIQSDWAQMGRRQGFGAQEVEFSKPIYKGKDDKGRDTWVVNSKDADGLDRPHKFLGGPTDFPTKEAALEAIEYEKKIAPKTIGMPEGPVVGTTEKFTEVTLRRLIRKAADEGYDFIAWTPGKVQVDRWDDTGLRTYYDKVLPKVTKKIAKTLDKNVDVETISVNIDGEPQETLALRITDKTRKTAQEGLPLFAVPATAGAAAAVRPKEEANGNL